MRLLTLGRECRHTAIEKSINGQVSPLIGISEIVIDVDAKVKVLVSLDVKSTIKFAALNPRTMPKSTYQLKELLGTTRFRCDSEGGTCLLECFVCDITSAA